MKAATGLEMDGYVTDACTIITAGVDAGSWLKEDGPGPLPPPPPPPSPDQSDADVVWDTPSVDVLGSMPLGNGKLGVNVWADDTSAIGLLLSHVDALDENAQLDKLGRVMLRVPAPPPLLIQPPLAPASYTVHPGFAGKQPPIGTVNCTGSQADCPAQAQAACSKARGCTGFGLSPIWPVSWPNGGKAAELYAGTLADAHPNTAWTLWHNSNPAPPAPPTPPTQPFKMEYRLANMSVRVQLPVPQNVTVDVWVDATTQALRVESVGDAEHTLEATVEIWRNTTGQPYKFDSCYGANVTLAADTVLQESDGIYFYHRNPGAESATSMWPKDWAMQQMPSGAGNVLPDPQLNNTFGCLLTGVGGTVLVASGSMQMMSASPSKFQSVSVAGIAGVYSDEQQFKADLRAQANPASAPFNRSGHAAYWANFWASSDITVTASTNPKADPKIASAASRITLMDRVTRASFHSMAFGSQSAIKFNAYGIYSAYPNGQEDYRIWGPAQWFQNIRLPYYHMLHDGQYEAAKSLFNFYHRTLPVSKARSSRWFGINGSFFPETMQQNGLYASGGLGWACKSADPKGPLPGNTYIRYHREGGLELSLFAVDWFAHTNDGVYFQSSLLPQIELYVDYYAEHFKNAADGSGKLDIFPAQALETWQCKSVPPTRADCVTNPMPEVAGLTILLPRLLALDPATSGITTAMQVKWKALLTRVPSLPSGGCRIGGGDCFVAGASLPSKASNAENAELYAVHPYRVVGIKSNRAKGIATFYARRFQGSTGWSEDFMDAALLGLANETAGEAIARANVAPYDGYRWLGFQAGIGAGGPITDHMGVGTAGLRYMLMHHGATEANGSFASNKIIMLPAWPCNDWAVHFKLHAPDNTVVEGYYDGAGRINGFSVTPTERKPDIEFAGCVANPEEDVTWA